MDFLSFTVRRVDRRREVQEDLRCLALGAQRLAVGASARLDGDVLDVEGIDAWARRVGFLWVEVKGASGGELEKQSSVHVVTRASALPECELGLDQFNTWTHEQFGRYSYGCFGQMLASLAI